ncbi:MAG: hypothetical protein KKC46_06175 [Proteobacteria bacterium]|nr:hypothetical protein [Pseudomonadota bacterium]
MMFKLLMMSLILIASSIHDARALDVVYAIDMDKLIEHKDVNRSSVQLQNKEDFKKLFRRWASMSMDIEKSDKRFSRKYNRTTYKQLHVSDRIRSLNERLNLSPGSKDYLNQSLKNMPGRTLAFNRHFKTIYRESDSNYSFWKFKDAKEVSRIRNEDKLIEKARQFLIDNNFVIETKHDKIDYIVVLNKKLDEDSGKESVSRTFLLRQDVIFRRSYKGNPVLNSMIVVSVIPDTLEIVVFKHKNWTPLNDGKTTSNKLTTDLYSHKRILRDKISKAIKVEGENWDTAVVKKIIPSWFQTNGELLPMNEVKVLLQSKTTGEKRFRSLIIGQNNDDQEKIDLFFKPNTAKRPQ